LLASSQEGDVWDKEDRELERARQAEFDLVGGFRGMIRNELLVRLRPLTGRQWVGTSVGTLWSILAQLSQYLGNNQGRLESGYGYVKEVKISKRDFGVEFEATFWPRFSGKEERVLAEVRIFSDTLLVHVMGMPEVALY